MAWLNIFQHFIYIPFIYLYILYLTEKYLSELYSLNKRPQHILHRLHFHYNYHTLLNKYQYFQAQEIHIIFISNQSVMNKTLNRITAWFHFPLGKLHSLYSTITVLYSKTSFIKIHHKMKVKK